MKKVGRGDYLYLRGGVFYFRRSVPPDANLAFGRSEVVVSLGTRHIAEARHRLSAELRKFEKTLSQVRGSVAPIERLARSVGVPSLDDLEVAVRGWLKARNERSGIRLAAMDADEEDAALDAIKGERWFLDEASLGKVIQPPVGTEWIASHLIEQHGWEIETGGPLHRRLTRSQPAMRSSV